MSKIQRFILPVLVAVFTSASLQAQEYPEATATESANVVISPYPPNKKIDITGFLPGDLARDPHSNKVFRVPAKKATPLVFKPEIIDDDPPAVRRPSPPTPPSTVDLDSLPIRKPEIVEEPEPVRKPIPLDPTTLPGTTTPKPPMTVASVPSVPETTDPEPPVVEPVPEPVIPARPPREIESELSDFVKVFIRAGQNDDPSVQGAYLAPTLSRYYSLREVSKDQVATGRAAFVSKWPRRIYVVSGKPRFVRWISTEDVEDEFVIDVRVYQSLKSGSGTTKRGYADHRLSIHVKSDGTFEVTGAEERYPRSVVAG